MARNDTDLDTDPRTSPVTVTQPSKQLRQIRAEPCAPLSVVPPSASWSALHLQALFHLDEFIHGEYLAEGDARASEVGAEVCAWLCGYGSGGKRG
jgi:hypothetical protein